SYFDAIKQQKSDPFSVPDGIFSFYDSVIVFDHKERQMRIVSFRGEEHCAQLLDQLESPAEREALAPFSQADSDPFKKVTPAMTRQAFVDRVGRCKEYISEGQVFQIVLAQRFAYKYDGDPFRIYRSLQSINPSPYGYYLQFPDFSYLGASP